jgi:hypothetical protein
MNETVTKKYIVTKIRGVIDYALPYEGKLVAGQTISDNDIEWIWDEFFDSPNLSREMKGRMKQGKLLSDQTLQLSEGKPIKIRQGTYVAYIENPDGSPRDFIIQLYEEGEATQVENNAAGGRRKKVKSKKQRKTISKRSKRTKSTRRR